MIFINPKTDFAFKKIFGSDQSHDILISFLNAILYDGQPTIESLEILNPYVAPRIRGMKDSYLDVRAALNNGDSVIIEMQVLNVEGFEKRILYNATKIYSGQLDQGDSYTILKPVIALTIVDFLMFEQCPDITSRFVLKDRTYLLDYPICDIELVFVELPKFKKKEAELASLTDKWLYFLQQARRLHDIPETMEDVPEIKKAFQIANQVGLTPEELDAQERHEIFVQDVRGAISKAEKDARRTALQEGRQEGRQEGLQEGRQAGLQEGRQETTIEIARQLLDVLDVETISQKTGLTIAEVQSLRKSS